MISSYSDRLFNNSIAVVVPIGRLMYRVTSIVPSRLRYKIHIKKIA